MDYIIGAAAGLVFGGLVGIIKYLALWRKFVGDSGEEMTAAALYTRMIISNLVNVGALLAVFLLRNLLPFDFVAPLLGAAVGISLAGKLSPMKKIVTHVKEDTSC